MELVVAVLAALLLRELYAWLPKLSILMVEVAVWFLPADERERYREEWRAGIAEFPNSIMQLLHAASHLFSIHRVRGEILQGLLSELEEKLVLIAKSATDLRGHLVFTESTTERVHRANEMMQDVISSASGPLRDSVLLNDNLVQRVDAFVDTSYSIMTALEMMERRGKEAHEAATAFVAGIEATISDYKATLFAARLRPSSRNAKKLKQLRLRLEQQTASLTEIADDWALANNEARGIMLEMSLEQIFALLSDLSEVLSPSLPIEGMNG